MATPYARLVRNLDSGGRLTDVTSISTGFFHACASRTDGTVACWGGNANLVVGATANPQPTPTTVRAVVAGAEVSCALTRTGEVWCWGANATGSLGRGTTGADSGVPMPVRSVSGPGNLTGVDEIAAGGEHVCARLGGEVVCWGSNTYGQLGDGTTTNRPRPVYVLTGAARLAGADALALGVGHSCARVGAEIRCWGRNTVGQVGDGTFTSPRTAPARVVRVGAIALSGGSMLRAGGGAVHTCVQIGPQPHCWGWNAMGELGNGDRITRDGATPVLAPLLP